MEHKQEADDLESLLLLFYKVILYTDIKYKMFLELNFISHCFLPQNNMKFL